MTSYTRNQIAVIKINERNYFCIFLCSIQILYSSSVQTANNANVICKCNMQIIFLL